MKIVHYSQAEARTFDNPPAKGVTGRVVIGKMDGAVHFCMRVFELAPGGHTPFHVHEWEHEIFVHRGNGVVFRQGEWIQVSQGSVVYIPGNEEHQMKNAGEEPFVFVCLVPSGVPEL